LYTIVKQINDDDDNDDIYASLKNAVVICSAVIINK